MPRYFFQFTDGRRVFGDSEGLELAGLHAARAHATRQVRDLKAAMCDPHVQDLTGWSMTVTDAAGRIVFVLGFDMKPRPQETVPFMPTRPPSSPDR